jgi:hypothetical protein
MVMTGSADAGAAMRPLTTAIAVRMPSRRDVTDI